AAQFLAGSEAAGLADLKAWLKAHRGLPDVLLRFDPSAVPAHLMPGLRVRADGKEPVQGGTLAQLRRASAAAARTELGRRAQARFGQHGAWRRFDSDELPESVPLEMEEGVVWVYPAVVRVGQAFEVRYEWSDAEARRSWRRGAAQLARHLLGAQARDLGKIIAANTALLLAAVPYLSGDALEELLLQWVFRRACFGDAEAPRSREAYEQAVDRGRARLHPCLDEIAAQLLRWFTDARAVRRALDESRAPLLADAVDESHQHLRRLLCADTLESMAPDWLRQVPRYLQAESRRWQRAAARGTEPPKVLRELREWSARYRQLVQQVGAEMRWIP